MPTSGARSGTTRQRYMPAGTGEPEPIVELRCGHHADSEPVIVYPANKRRYWCEQCRTLVAPR
jgi:hypothetical protein